MDEQVVILAGGLATRLYPLTKKMPKSMIPIKGKPFLEHQIKLCKKNGCFRIVFCGGHLWEMVFDYFGDGKDFGVEIVYSIEKERLDTGGALKNARPFLDDEFFVLYGDSYLTINWYSVWKVYEESQFHFRFWTKPIVEGVMSVYRNRQNDRLKSQISLGEDGFVKEFTKTNFKPEMKYVEYGLNILKKKTLDLIPHKTFPISLYFDLLIENQSLIAYKTNRKFYEIGSFEGIKKLTDLLD